MPATESSLPILYTQNGCAESPKVRVWLDNQGIEFLERNVSTDVEAAGDLAATGVFATPLLVVGQHKVIGYRPGALAAAFQTEEAGSA